MNQKTAKLRVCARCEWVFKHKKHPETGGCPLCGFAHYGARWVYGDEAYKYYITQEPFLKRKVDDYSYTLLKEVEGYREVPLIRSFK